MTEKFLKEIESIIERLIYVLEIEPGGDPVCHRKILETLLVNIIRLGKKKERFVHEEIEGVWGARGNPYFEAPDLECAVPGAEVLIGCRSYTYRKRGRDRHYIRECLHRDLKGDDEKIIVLYWPGMVRHFIKCHRCLCHRERYYSFLLSLQRWISCLCEERNLLKVS